MTTLALGSFAFSTTTAAYASLQHVCGWKWGEQERVGNVPTLHYTGREAEKITLPGAIYPLQGGAGLGQLAALRTLADKGEALSMADGRGRSLGKWVINGITEEQSELLPGGAPRKQSFTITLTRYHEN